MPGQTVEELSVELKLASTLARDIDRELGQATSAVSRASKTQTRAVEQQISSLRSRASDLSQIGGTLTRGVTLPVAAAGAAAIKSAIDFESAFAGVRKTVEATEPEFAKLRTGILEMSKALPASKEEIAGVAEAAGQLGIKQENILGFTRTMIDLGESTNLASTEAATALARLANITGMPQSQFQRLGSTIVALGNNLATTEAEIVEMGLRIAGAGKQVGLSEAQILSFAGALSSVGIEAQAGGTAISRTFISMAQAVATGSDELGGFARVAGMSASQFQRQFKDDAAGAMVSFIEGLEGIRRAGGDVFTTLDKLGIAEIRQRDALLRASGAGDQFRKALALGNQAWEDNNALTEEASKRYATTESRLKILRNRIMAAAVPLGEALLPALTTIAEVVAKVAEGFSALPGPVRTAIVVFAGLAAMAGPLLKLRATILSLRAATLALSLAQGAGGLAGAAGSVGTAIGGLGSKMGGLAGSTGLAAGAMLPLTAAVAGGVAVWKVWNNKVDATAEGLERYRGAAAKAEAVEERLTAATRDAQAAQREVNRLRKDGRTKTDEYKAAVDRLVQARDAEFEQFREKSSAQRDQIAGLEEATRSLVAPNLGQQFDNLFSIGGARADTAARRFEEGIFKIVEASRDLPLGTLRGFINSFDIPADQKQRVLDAVTSLRGELDSFAKQRADVNKQLGITIDLTRFQTDRWAQQQAVLGGVFDEWQRGTATNREMGLTLKESVATILEHNFAWAKQEAQAGRSVNAVQETITTLEAMQEAFPPLRSQIQGYIDKLNGIPTARRTDVTNNAKQARARAVEYARILSTIPREVATRITVTASGDIRTIRPEFFAEGGRLRPGETGISGEAGPELLRALPGGGVDITPLKDVMAATAGFVPPPAPGSPSGGSGGAGASIQLIINNPAPEPASTSLPKAMRRIKVLNGTRR